MGHVVIPAQQIFSDELLLPGGPSRELIILLINDQNYVGRRRAQWTPHLRVSFFVDLANASIN
jgi:hypothetical protein